MKKTGKKIPPILFVSIFLLLNSLLLTTKVQATDFFYSKGESVSCFCTDLYTTGIQSFFNEEEWDDFEKDFIVPAQQLLVLSANLYILIPVEGNSMIYCQQFIFALQADLPPPEFV